MLKYFDIESVKIACWVNEGDFDASKQNLLFIHGSGGNHGIWSYQYGRLHKKYNIAAVDLSGHGNSQGKGERDVQRYCEWMKKLLDVLDMKKAVLVGHSLGASIALRFAISYSEEIAGIVCIGGGIKTPVNPFILEFLKTKSGADAGRNNRLDLQILAGKRKP
jgi:pimeloyl-ACP methyl ester carboxylesterase